METVLTIWTARVHVIRHHQSRLHYADSGELYMFLGSYALHTDPIVRGNLVSVSVCHFEDEKTRDTQTSHR